MEGHSKLVFEIFEKHCVTAVLIENRLFVMNEFALNSALAICRAIR